MKGINMKLCKGNELFCLLGKAEQIISVSILCSSKTSSTTILQYHSLCDNLKYFSIPLIKATECNCDTS